MADDPADPVTPLNQMAAAFHEFYLSLAGAGFTDGQALYLTGCWVRSLVTGGQP